MLYHNTLDATLFTQRSAEWCALYLQAFALAELRLLVEVQRRTQARMPAESLYVVSDLDETLLDNSAYNAWILQTGRDFHDDTWSQWCQQRQALATPGAVDFAKFVVEHGARLVYVSSRFDRDREATADNLRELGFPLPDFSSDPNLTHLFLSGMPLQGKPSKKREQFAWLEQRFGGEPMLWLGDNLSDHHPELYSSRVDGEQRRVRVLEKDYRWGHQWIVFPNAIYGSWRQALGKADEEPAAPFQPQPVRPALESPKGPLLHTWPSPGPDESQP